MSITGAVDLGNGRIAATIDHDPTSTPTDALKGSMFIDASGDWWRKIDDGSTTNVVKIENETGPTGPGGGETGPTGPGGGETGPTGPIGETGPTGSGSADLQALLTTLEGDIIVDNEGNVVHE